MAVRLYSSDGVTLKFTFSEPDSVSWAFDKVGLDDYNLGGAIRPDATDDWGQQRVWTIEGKFVVSGANTPFSLFNDLDTLMQAIATVYVLQVDFPKGEGVTPGVYTAVVLSNGGVGIKTFNGSITGAPQFVPYSVTLTEVVRIN